MYPDFLLTYFAVSCCADAKDYTKEGVHSSDRANNLGAKGKAPDLSQSKVQGASSWEKILCNPLQDVIGLITDSHIML